jgi:uncharacterized membrane protein HdeD (DUF308 family)
MVDIAIGAVEIAVGILIIAIPRIGVGTLAILVAIAFILRGIGEMTLGWALRKAP